MSDQTPDQAAEIAEAMSVDDALDVVTMTGRQIAARFPADDVCGVREEAQSVLTDALATAQAARIAFERCLDTLTEIDHLLGVYDTPVSAVDELRRLLVEKEAAEASLAQLRGAMQADDERLRVAGGRVGLFFGCDTPEHLADEIEQVRASLAQLQQEAREVARGFRSEAMNGVICLPPSDIEGCPLWDAPPSRTWCPECRGLWRRLFALTGQDTPHEKG
jgi:hypothetical protein